jgi:hypothetical protein
VRYLGGATRVREQLLATTQFAVISVAKPNRIQLVAST